MAQFASDDFAGTENALLSTYNAAWTQHSGSATTAEIASGRVRGTAAGAAFYYHSGAPATADYSVSADVYEASNPPAYAAGVTGRTDTSAVTLYFARHARGSSGTVDAWQLYKAVAGTFTQLGSNVTDGINTGTSARVELRMVGTTIALYKRGESTAAISVTDSSITAAGKAGIRLGYSGSDTPSDTAAYHLDNFSADDLRTDLYLRNTTTNGIGSTYYDMVPTAGASADTAITASTAGGTEIQLTKTSGGALVNFVSGRSPVGGFTLTSVDVALWAREDNVLTNVGGRLRLFERTPGGTETEIGGGPFDDGVEFTTTDALYTWTANVTDTVIAEDNRIVAKLYLTNIGTMAAGDATITFNASGGPVGGSYISIFPAVAFKAEAGGAVTMGGLLLMGCGS